MPQSKSVNHPPVSGHFNLTSPLRKRLPRNPKSQEEIEYLRRVSLNKAARSREEMERKAGIRRERQRAQAAANKGIVRRRAMLAEREWEQKKLMRKLARKK